jgi:hypothetical protein
VTDLDRRDKISIISVLMVRILRTEDIIGPQSNLSSHGGVTFQTSYVSRVLLKTFSDRRIFLERQNEQGFYTRVYPKVSGLAAWSENCKWYSFLPLGVVVYLLCESV